MKMHSSSFDDRRKLLRAMGAFAATGWTLPIAAAEREADAPNQRPGETVVSSSGARVTLVVRDGGHLDWLAQRGGRILFDKRGADGYFDLWIMDADAGNPRNLTRRLPGLPGKHTGCPAWHPSGEWIVFQAQKAGIPRTYDNQAVPGGGTFNDLWVVRPDGSALTRVVEVSPRVSPDAAGVLHPHFSNSGEWLTWAERVGGGGGFGKWVIRLARFDSSRARPRVTEVRAINPYPNLASVFYETHGFSPDDRRLLFTSTGPGGMEIHEMELQGGALRVLTGNPSTWDEHAHYSPDGSRIAWMSSEGLAFKTQPFTLEAEFWTMGADGSNKRRITHFHDRSSPEHLTGFAVAADLAWRWDGRAFLGLVITGRPEGPRRGSGPIYLIEPQGIA
jgi:Tol biopolymer transport system component